VGWRQAVKAENAARGRVYELRYQVRATDPTTNAGAIALIDFIYAAQRTQVNSSNQDAPYGIGGHGAAAIARRVTRFFRQRLSPEGLSKLAD
jgi:hypothetical protein